MTTIHAILDEFRQAKISYRDMGDKFERLIANYLVTDPLYQDKYSAVWLWTEWPGRDHQPDTGIDLVAKERWTNDYCAIQCKFYDPSYGLQKSDIDSFFTASGKSPFTSRMIVATTDKWSKHAEEALKNQHIPVTRLRVQDLADSPIDWSRFSLHRPQTIRLKEKKKLRPHQKIALAKVEAGFRKNARGRLIMACGTGKTFTALKIAERIASDGTVLFLVPSISLLSQTLREWTAEAEESLRPFAVCSDTKVGKKSASEDIGIHDLPFPATTDARILADQIRTFKEKTQLTVIFSTYQSIETVAKAQAQGVPEFDLIICDEAHRTTGVTLEGEEESYFVRVHDQGFIKGKKRLYMTATPRIYSDGTKAQAQEAEAALCSMDDEEVYGPEFHRLGFSEAVGSGLLTDYKVMVLAVDEKYVSKTFQNQLADANNELNLEDAVKIIGCWNGLSKRIAKGADGADFETDNKPMRRAVAFSRSIKDSQRITQLFSQIIEHYHRQNQQDAELLACEVDHVDGTFNALKRNEKLDWLKADAKGNICRILSNARCLSEGVDMPALDAVMFLNPRNSVVDVVQSVGRVMRKAEGKRYGYIILPVGIPADQKPEEALKDNQKYKVVWQVLQALRAHDDRFNATVNQIELNKKRPDQIQIIGVGDESEEGDTRDPRQFDIVLPELEAWKDAIYAKIIIKCGDRRYWEDWAKDVARIAERHIARITALLESSDKARQAFDRFLSGLRENINPAIGQDEAIEMLSQHLITRPVFDALFENYAFTRHNPVSLSMQEVLDVLEAQALEKEVEALQGFYESVRQRIKGIDNAEGRQKVVIELYDKFFKLAFPKMSDRLGIVYTPVEVVDFIVQSAEDALRAHFGVGFTDEGVHILDPFTGTGTFIVRLLQSGLIQPEDLERKYKEELHANEIVLLAYYIAAINIEETYHGLQGGAYQPFEGIVLADTFQMSEEVKQQGFGEAMFPENNKRVSRQKQKDIRVIMGNPPYSALQESANDNNANLKYPNLDARIRETYAARSTATNKNSLYDSYKRAICWASDRIEDQGVIGFVTNGSFIDGNADDGLRKCLMEEFSTIYCFNLRGNQRTSGELSRKEGGKIFGSGSRTPVAITLLIKDPRHEGPCKLFYHDIGDYLSREEKLHIIQDFGSIKRLPWKQITPNAEGDWINQRNPEFDTFMRLGAKEDKSANTVFETYSSGLKSNRDAWVYNFSKKAVHANMNRMIDFYNQEVERYRKMCEGKAKDRSPDVNGFVNSDSKKISWTVNLKTELVQKRQHKFDKSCIVQSLYRPFSKQWMYFNRRLNERVYQIPRLFPTPCHKNIVISVTGVGASKPFSAVMTNAIPNLHLHDTGQCFPLYWYEKAGDTAKERVNNDCFEPDESIPDESVDEHGYIRREAITDWALGEFRKHYQDETIDKEAIFYYVYGVLHSPQYRDNNESSLRKMLPRIPFALDFWAFSKAGRELAYWHLNYETVEPWPLTEEVDRLIMEDAEYRVTGKMAFGKSGKMVDKTTIIYNSHIALIGIPPEAYDYVVNGKSALEWIMERYAVTVDKDSGLRNDPNDWSDDPPYIVNLVKRLVRVSLETMKIVNALPALNEQDALANNESAVRELGDESLKKSAVEIT